MDRGVLREFIEHRSCGGLKQRQGGAQHATLEGGIVRDSQGAPELEGYPQGAWRLDDGGMLTYQADLSGRDATAFQVMGERANGARTGRSNRHEAYGIDVVLGQQAGQVMGRRFHVFGVRRSHKGIVERCDAADDSLRCQSVQAVEGQDDIPILLKAGAIEVRRHMAHHQVIGGNVAGNDALVPRDGPPIAGGHGKRLVVPPM